jgi:hypothetical protein
MVVVLKDAMEKFESNVSLVQNINYWVIFPAPKVIGLNLFSHYWVILIHSFEDWVVDNQSFDGVRRGELKFSSVINGGSSFEVTINYKNFLNVVLDVE